MKEITLDDIIDEIHGLRDSQKGITGVINQHSLDIKELKCCVEDMRHDINELKQADMSVTELLNEQMRILIPLDQRINKNGLTDAVKDNAKSIKDMSRQFWIGIVILAFIAGDKVYEYLKILL